METRELGWTDHFDYGCITSEINRVNKGDQRSGNHFLLDIEPLSQQQRQQQ